MSGEDWVEVAFNEKVVYINKLVDQEIKNLETEQLQTVTHVLPWSPSECFEKKRENRYVECFENRWHNRLGELKALLGQNRLPAKND